MEEKKTTETENTTTNTESTPAATADTSATAAATSTSVTNETASSDSSDAGPVTDTSTTSTPVTPAATTAATTKDDATKTGGAGMKQYGIALVIVLVITAAFVYMLEQQGRIDTNYFGFLAGSEQSQPVAVVNGVEITNAEFEQNRSQVIASAQQQGIDTEDPEIQAEIDSQAIEVLVNTQLLRQAANAAGITVSADEVDARYQEIVESVGGEETLTSRMSELGITPESLRTDIEGELLVQALIDTEVDVSGVTVTEEEVQSIYDQAGGPDAGLPPLEEVRSEIEQQIITTQEQELLTEYIESLRAEADIQILNQ